MEIARWVEVLSESLAESIPHCNVYFFSLDQVTYVDEQGKIIQLSFPPHLRNPF
jgi:hypothetical protein